MMKPGNVQMIFLHGQTCAMPFSVGITGARESRIKSVGGVGFHSWGGSRVKLEIEIAYLS